MAFAGLERRLRKRRTTTRQSTKIADSPSPRSPPGPSGHGAPGALTPSRSSPISRGRSTSGRHADAIVTDRAGCCSEFLPQAARRCSSRTKWRAWIGAAHAGVARGLRRRQTDPTIEGDGAARRRSRPDAAAVGPCIGPASYEVDDGFRDRFLAEDLENVRFCRDGPAGKPHFDLPPMSFTDCSRPGSAKSRRFRPRRLCRSARFFSYRLRHTSRRSRYRPPVSAIALTD